MRPQANFKSDMLTSPPITRGISSIPGMGERGYTVDRIVRHTWSGQSLKYVVRWLRYTPNDDRFQLPEHIPQLLIARFWRRTQRQQGYKPKKIHTRQSGLH